MVNVRRNCEAKGSAMTRKFSELRARMAPQSRARAEGKAQGMLEHLNADLRTAIHEGMTSGPSVPAIDGFASSKARHEEPKPAPQLGGKLGLRRSFPK